MTCSITFNPGDQIYKYQLIRKIGEGGFGQVWLAYDATIDQNMAVKIIHIDSPIDITHFRESRIGSHFNNANLVKIHYADITEYSGNNFIVIAMDFLSNGSIIAKTNSLGFIELPVAVNYMRNVLFGLDHLHHLNFFHNDIKPNNILIGNAGQAVLSDYGVTYTNVDSGSTHVQSYVIHRPPETQTSRTINIATDIYQCGITAFRIFARLNFFDDILQSIGRGEYERRITTGTLLRDVDFPPYVPNRIRNIIKKAISIDPSNRYSSAYEMLEDFNKIAYPGYWTSDAHNNLIGMKGKYEFYFEVQPISAKKYNFIAKKKHNESHRVTTISQFSKTNISYSEIKRVKNNFIKDIIET